jgi:hypothetical protein
VVGGAAGDDHDPFQVAQVAVVEGDVGEIDSLVARQAVGQGLGDGVGLFVDLLQHEGLEAALLGGVGVPAHLFGSALDGDPVGVGDAHLAGLDFDDLAVFDRDRDAGVGEEGRDRRGEEGLALADAGDQRTLLASPDQAPGLVGVHGDEGVVAAQLGIGGADRGGEVALVVGGDQVGDDLGVGLGGEALAVGLQPLAQAGVVLDDPVEDDVDLAGAVVVGMGVLLGDAAVGRPAGMGDAGVGGRQGAGAVGGALLDRGAEIGEVADGVHALDLAVLDQREAGRVIAAVFELFQPREQQLLAGPTTHVSDDSAHKGE